MARRLDWDRVRAEARMRRNGAEPAWADPAALRPQREEDDFKQTRTKSTIIVTRLKRGSIGGVVRCPACFAEMGAKKIAKHFHLRHPHYSLDRNWQIGDKHFDEAGGWAPGRPLSKAGNGPTKTITKKGVVRPRARR